LKCAYLQSGGLRGAGSISIDVLPRPYKMPVGVWGVVDALTVEHLF